MILSMKMKWFYLYYRRKRLGLIFVAKVLRTTVISSKFFYGIQQEEIVIANSYKLI